MGATSKTFPIWEAKHFNRSQKYKLQKANSLWFFAVLFIECGTDFLKNAFKVENTLKIKKHISDYSLCFKKAFKARVEG